MTNPHRCPRCGSHVEREGVDIDGIESQRIECPSCDRTLVGTACPECEPAGEDPADADEDCPACGGEGVVLTTLSDLLS
jgi:hypothetical protein